MIIVKLKGGLGNQMFQYAAGKQLAEKLNVPLKLDIAFLTADASDRTKRTYELDKFNITADVISPEEVEEIKVENGKRNPFHFFHVRERYYKVLKPFLQSGNSYYLSGYWQSDKYFDNITSILRQEFTCKKSLEGAYFTELRGAIEETNSVAIHFRRGDYVTDAKTNKHHGVCSLAYYEKAVELLAERVEELHLFVFSDDISWVKTNFKTHFPITFVEESDENLLSDFRLMSACKHNVIANSSYSWWAAWLNPNEDKIVIAPKKWYKDKLKQLQASDRVPEKWLKI